MIEQLTELLNGATEENLAQIDEQIAELERQAETLREVRKLVAVRLGDKPRRKYTKRQPTEQPEQVAETPKVPDVAPLEKNASGVFETGEPRPTLKPEPTAKPEVVLPPTQPNDTTPRPTHSQRKRLMLRILGAANGKAVPAKDLALSLGVALDRLGYYTSGGLTVCSIAGYTLTPKGKEEAAKLPPEGEDED